MKIKIPKKLNISKINFLKKVTFLSGKELLANTIFTIILCTLIAFASMGLDRLIQFIIKLT